jgi:hypothetical protein
MLDYQRSVRRPSARTIRDLSARELFECRDMLLDLACKFPDQESAWLQLSSEYEGEIARRRKAAWEVYCHSLWLLRVEEYPPNPYK